MSFSNKLCKANCIEPKLNCGFSPVSILNNPHILSSNSVKHVFNLFRLTVSVDHISESQTEARLGRKIHNIVNSACAGKFITFINSSLEEYFQRNGS
jgi:hypothetical protein